MIQMRHATASPVAVAVILALGVALVLMWAGCAKEVHPGVQAPETTGGPAEDGPPEDSTHAPEEVSERIIHEEGLADVTETEKNVLDAVCKQGDRLRAIVQEGARIQSLFEIEEPYTLSWHREDVAVDEKVGFTAGRVTRVSALIEECGEPVRTTEGPATDREGPARERIVATHWWGNGVGLGVDASGTILEVCVSAQANGDGED